MPEVEYQVEWLAGGVGAGPTSKLHHGQIERQWTPPTGKVLRHWLRDSAFCEEVQVRGI